MHSSRTLFKRALLTMASPPSHHSVLHTMRLSRKEQHTMPMIIKGTKRTGLFSWRDPEMENLLNYQCPLQMPEIVNEWNAWTTALNRVAVLLSIMFISTITGVVLVLVSVLTDWTTLPISGVFYLIAFTCGVIIFLIMRRGDEHQDQFDRLHFDCMTQRMEDV